MIITAKFTEEPGFGILTIDGEEFDGPLPPTDGHLRRIYEAWIADGNRPEDYMPPEPDPVVKTWDRALDFKLEFTMEERAQMRGFAKVDPVAEDFLDLLNSATRIVADDPLLLQGLAYMVGNGILTQPRVDAILHAPTTLHPNPA